MVRERAKRWAAEAVGTAILVGLGTGSNVAAARAGGEPQWLLAIAWSGAVTIPVFLFLRISGAHLNPVVTASLALSGRIEWFDVPAYILAQFGGAFLGSASVLVTLGKIDNLGATIPTGGDTTVAFVMELGFTALLVVGVFVLTDHGEGRWRWRSLLPGTIVGLATLVIGPWTGSSLNPARTVAPAVLADAYGNLWVYLLAIPLGAAIVGVLWRSKTGGPQGDLVKLE